MFKYSHKTRLATLLLLGAPACTFITDANERTVTGGKGDLRFTFKSMTVHEGAPMDVAIVNQDNLLQGRARIILPPKPAMKDYPDVQLVMEGALGSGSYRLFFYIDDNQNNLVDRAADGDVLEHIWQEPVPKSGSGSFTHSLAFKPFTEDEITDIGGDIVFQAPMVPAAASEAIKLCLTQKLNAAVRTSLELKVFVAEEERQIAEFATFRGNALPADVRLSGIVDAPNSYRFDVFVDGEKTDSFNLDSVAGADLLVPASDWLPLTAADVTSCLRPGA